MIGAVACNGEELKLCSYQGCSTALPLPSVSSAAPRLFWVSADWSGTRKQCDVRTARLNGPIAQALFAQAPALFAAPPAIERYEVIGAKV